QRGLLGNNLPDYLIKLFNLYVQNKHLHLSKSYLPILSHSLPVGELSSSVDKIALDIAIKVYSVFDWIPADAAVRNLIEDQKKLIERRL
ncbi:hypothetical protein ACFLT8_06480, partial [Chloroflexota bacterium]